MHVNSLFVENLLNIVSINPRNSLTLVEYRAKEFSTLLAMHVTLWEVDYTGGGIFIFNHHDYN